jgi:hypothetical protein
MALDVDGQQGAIFCQVFRGFLATFIALVDISDLLGSPRMLMEVGHHTHSASH